MEFRVLGGLVATREGSPIELGGRKQRAVLAALLLEHGRPVSAARLEEHVWGTAMPANPETSLQAYVSNLRRALEPERKPREPARLLVTQPAGYALLAPRESVDATRFEDLVASGATALRAGDVPGAASTLDTALGLWTGPLLPELAGHAIVDESVARLEGLRATALEHRIDAGLRLGEHVALLPRIEAAVGDHPFHERFRAQHALALYRAGRQRDALAALAAARRVLAEEVGLDPGAELRQLEAQILGQDPALDAPAPAAAVRGAEPSAAPPTPTAPPAVGADGQTRDGAVVEVSPFVGRERELAALREAAAAAAAGTGRAAVISGEPGIGKTRLVEELAALLPDAVVAWGRCPESGAGAAYWPCIQIGRQLEGNDALDAALVTELLPTAPPGFGSVPAPERFNLHVAIADVLASARRPMVLVIDDVQWADPATLRVLEFLAAELRRAPVLVVVTTRPVGPDAPDALIDCLGELARAPGSIRIELSGLSGTEVGRWLALRHGPSAPPQVAQVVHHRTRGNPFFVGEVLELLGTGDSGDEASRLGSGVPAAVQDVVRRRVSRLPVATQQLLAAASVVGRTFDVDVLAAVAETGTIDVLDRVDPALAAGLLEETDLPGRFQFSHALVAETLQAEVAPGRRARLHAATAGALARLRASALDSHLADLAHHAVEGMAAGIAEQAFEWSARVARQATLQGAHEDAAEHWGRAVRAVQLADPTDARRRYDALLEQGRAWLRVDDVTAGYAALTAAIDLAVTMGDPALAATAGAAMSIDGLWQAGEIAMTSANAVGALERALELMPADPTPERAAILGTLAENAYWLWPAERLDGVTAVAVQVARELGDPTVLGRALHKRNQTLWKPGTLDIRADAAFELLELTETVALPLEVRGVALFGAAGVLWEQADARRAATLVEEASAIGARLDSPALLTQLDYFQAALRGFFGDLDGCEAAAHRAHELYRRTRRWNADAIHAGNLLVPLLERDRIDELDAVAHDLLGTDYRPWFQEGYALALVFQGRNDEAAALVGGQLPPLVDCWMLLGVLSGGARVRVAIGDAAGAQVLADLLRPYEGQLSTVGTGPSFGDVHGALSAVDAMVGDAESALRHADASVEVLTKAGAGPFLARALLHRAGLRPETAADDRRQAAALIERFDLRLLRRQHAPAA